MESKAHILLIDDDSDTLQMYTFLLRKQDMYVHEFLSPLDALAFLRFTDIFIEMIISDLNMPLMDGLKFVRQVRSLSRYIHTPFLFLSAVNNASIKLDAYRNGVIDYVQKPVDNELFIAKIESILQSYRLNSLKNNIILQGSQRIFSLEEIIQFCEQEKVNGFAFIRNKPNQGQFQFEKGVLKHIICGELTESAAFETMSSWKTYKFLIARGKFNPAAAQFLGE